MMSHRAMLAGGAVLGFLGVLAGAFGSHALKEVLEPQKLASFETGVRYQVFHALALVMLAAAGSAMKLPLRRPAWMFLVGTVLFSGSIYGLVLAEWKWLVPLTPIGGALLMLGWAWLFLSAVRSQRESNV